MERTTKEARENNAKKFYDALKEKKSAAIIVERQNSTSNPYVNRTKLLTTVGSISGYPMVIAESPMLGIEGCFIELFVSLGCSVQKTMREAGFSEWMKETFGIKITYNDKYVMMVAYENAD